MISWLWCTALAPVINDQNLVIMGNNEVIMSINYYLLLPIMDPVIMSNNEVIMSIHYYLLLPIMYLCTKIMKNVGLFTTSVRTVVVKVPNR